jgi:hypothetical protein
MTDREKASFLNGITFGAALLGKGYCVEHLFEAAAKALRFPEEFLDTVYEDVLKETDEQLDAGGFGHEHGTKH